jgi:AraC-like DNA-binding protein
MTFDWRMIPVNPERPGSTGTTTMIKPGPNDKIYPPTKLASIVQSLASEGVSAAEALRGTHLSPHMLRTPGIRVSFNQMIDACRNAEQLSRDPRFAFHTGLRFHVTTYGMFGFAILSSVTLRQAISFALQYQELATPLLDFSFREEHGRGKWILLPIHDARIDSALNRFLVELELAAGISLARDIMGSSFVAKEALLTFAQPRDASIYPSMFRCAVRFGQRENQLVFDAAWLDRAPQLGNAITYAEVVKICDMLMDQMRLRIGLSGKVREVLLLNVMKELTLEATAEQLHMTARTLRRRLRQENTSFRKLVDDLRMRLAIRYLADTSLTIEAVAHSLGFSDDASFRHAFRRWTHTAPVEFRARLRKRPVGETQAALPLLGPPLGQILPKGPARHPRGSRSGHK